MFSFGKPSTPTKNRQIAKQFTPTKSKSMSSSSGNNGSSAKVLEEINVLLYLESLKRSRDTELFLSQRIEEAYKSFEGRRHNYHYLVAKYAELVKLASTRQVLLRNDLADVPTESAQEDANHIIMKLSSGSATDYISTIELNKFKEMLQRMEKYNNLSIRSSELADLQNATDAIQNSIKAIEKLLEKCIVQGMDHFTDTLNMSNYPKLPLGNEDIE